jgi:L-Lysine epsilon oxidase N-terminal/L-lysine epsilon oxidase C-terminal domain
VSTTFGIHPAIGIARLGNSTEFYPGPEVPGLPASIADGKFRDATGKLRRQGARFRVFAADSSTGSATEVVAGATIEGKKVRAIEWTAHLANKKAFWFEFDGLTGEGATAYPAGHPMRNGRLSDPMADRRKKYVIDFGPRTLAGAGQSAKFSKGTGGGYPETFPGPLHNGAAPVEILELGEMHTDADGLLTVVGGFGISGHRGGVPSGGLHYANNPEWFDDTADGPVSARVLYDDGTADAVVQGAWVVVGPPDYAPEIANLVTLHDLLFDMAVRVFGVKPNLFDPAVGQFLPTYEPSYTREIYPILKRTGDYRWVIATGSMKHNWNYAALGAKPYVAAPGQRSPTEIFGRIRKPADWHNAFDVDDKMPQIFGDTGENTSSLTLTRTQHHILNQWKDGVFKSDWAGPPAPEGGITPDGLDRAALDHCIGGAFFPGIEAGWVLRDPRVYAGPFRLKPPGSDEFDFMELTPGSVTMRSALPWQADFLKCATHWWPAARPNQVHTDTAGTVGQWDRTIAGHLSMVQTWHQLKLVLATTSSAGIPIFAEEP